MKKRFRHFSHVIIKFFIQNASEFHKRKKIIRKFFSLHNVQFRCLISLRHFFFRFLKRNIFFFFHRFQNQIHFSTFFRFLKFVVALDLHYNVIAQQDFQIFHKKKSNRIVIVICEEIYRDFVLICKKFDIRKC